ncbi:calcium-binding protein [Vibrio diabolicus]|uniref:calcium-binding protein n=1 Tax=Vibrio diabolicus TaxID=50719 RepID=UPI00215FEC32|nr:calcium-binding protein [Vibrio diabolicus]MCS0370123.1 calcium-binding protein [Vibrio diabolicus]
MSMLNLDLNWIFGTSQDDNMTGKKGSETTDIFFGFCGDDKFVGYGGNDVVFGGWGDDTLLGGRGNDFVSGGFGNDFLSGGLGNDKLFGGCGDDTIFDYSGNNYLSGGWGNDTLVVGDGESVLSGGCGDDTFVLTNRLAIGVPDQPVSSNDIDIKADIVDFNIFHDKLVFDMGRDTDNDGIRDTFLDSADDLTLSYNECGWAVFSSDEYNVEVTLNGVSSAYINYAEQNGIDIFDFA